MSKFPRLDLRMNERKKKVKKVKEAKEAKEKEHVSPDLPSLPSLPSSPSLRYFIYVIVIVVISIILIVTVPSSSVRHMKRLNCRVTSDGYFCDGPNYGDIIVKSSELCMNEMYDINGIPFNIARKGSIFRVPSSTHIKIKDASPHCKINVFHDSVSDSSVSEEFTWITTNDHTEFTVYYGDDVVLERVSSEFIDHVKQGRWISYTYPGDNVKGNSNAPIYQFL